MFDVIVALVFGFIGALLKEGGYPRVPLVVSIILSPFMERQFLIAGQIFDAGRVSVESLILTILLGGAVIGWVSWRLKRDHEKVKSRENGFSKFIGIFFNFIVFVTGFFTLYFYRNSVSFDFAYIAIFALLLICVVSFLMSLNASFYFSGGATENMSRYWILPFMAILAHFFGFAATLSVLGAFWCWDNSQGKSYPTIIIRCALVVSLTFVTVVFFSANLLWILRKLGRLCAPFM